MSDPIETWKNQLINDFEAPIFEAHPTLSNLKADLYHQGAIYASMSGSGSSLFGIFSKEKSISKNTFEHQYKMDII